MKNTNNDSISRQAALDKLNELKKVELVNAGNKPSKSYWALQAALMVVSGLPSAEPDGTDTSVGGTIYRQAAIDAINSHFGFSIEEEYGSAVQEVINGLPPAQIEQRCVNCGRTVNNGGWYKDGRTRCPIEEHYALPKDGYCHLWEKEKVWEDDYVKRPEEGESDG